MPDKGKSILDMFSFFILTTPNTMVNIILLFNQRKNWGLGRLNYCPRPQGKWSSWDLNPGLLTPVSFRQYALYAF